jgi:hypothetical protein
VSDQAHSVNADAAELWPTAIHESGHAVAAYLLRATVCAGPVALTVGTAHTGICFFGRAPRFRDVDPDTLAGPYALLPARLRHGYEARVMALLAGWTAEDLFVARGVVLPVHDAGSALGPAPEPMPEPSPEPARAVVLPRREQAMLDAAARDEPRSDIATALAIMTDFLGDEALAHKHGAFLAQETERLLAGPTARPMVEALATELLRHRSLSARRWRAILAAAA